MSSNKSNGYSSNGSLVVETHHHFLDELYKMMVKDVYDGGRNRDSKVVEFKHPKELEALMDLGLNKETSDDNLLKICQDIIKYSVKTGDLFSEIFEAIICITYSRFLILREYIIPRFIGFPSNRENIKWRMSKFYQSFM